MAERRYTPREEVWNWGSHLLGAVAVLLLGLPLLRPAGGFWLTAARIFYWFSMLAMCAASSCYHLTRDPERKALCRKFDHCAIYLLITGTYAPLMAGLIPDRRGVAVMAALIALTLIGIGVKFGCSNRFHRVEIVIYIIMGWLCLAVFRPLVSAMGRTSFILLLSGGIAYTAGVVFYVIKREFFHALWHFMVLSGVILQLFSILLLFRPAGK